MEKAYILCEVVDLESGLKKKLKQNKKKNSANWLEEFNTLVQSPVSVHALFFFPFLVDET
jgi:hypothetical protein